MDNTKTADWLASEIKRWLIQEAKAANKETKYFLKRGEFNNAHDSQMYVQHLDFLMARVEELQNQ